jgi:hypothetical protein
MKKGSLSICNAFPAMGHKHDHLVHEGARESEERAQQRVLILWPTVGQLQRVLRRATRMQVSASTIVTAPPDTNHPKPALGKAR